MKKNLVIAALMTVGIGAWAQEYDDMYFNSKDRTKANVNAATFASKSQLSDADAQDLSGRVNPTDSYSARSENPEYTSRSKFNANSNTENSDYFIAGYEQPVQVNPNFVRGNNFNNAGFNPYFNNFGFGNPWGFYDPFWGGFSPGWSTSIGWGWGGFNPGWYGSIGYGWGWGNSMWGWGSPWNSWNNWGWGSGWNNWGWGSGWYPGNVIIIDNGASNVAYRKRVSRSNDINNNYDPGSRNSTSYTRTGRSTDNAGGRTRVAGNESSQYYDRSWRRNSDATTTTRSYWNNSNNSSNRSGWNNSGWNNNNTNQGGRTSSWGSESRSSWSSGDGGSRSGGSSSGGSSSGGGSRSRGRN